MNARGAMGAGKRRVAAPDGHRRHDTPHDERWPRIIRVEPLYD